MPALPWTSGGPVAPTAEITVIASRLPLRSHRHIPGFLCWTWQIRRQLAQTGGLVGYALDAQLIRKTFWTVSAWESQRALGNFNRASPHSHAIAAIRPQMDQTTFVTWTTTAEHLPISWQEVRSRIEEAKHATP
jgi:hypothetical protein